MVRFGTYNLLNFEGPQTAADRYERLVDVIRGLNPDVLAVQEVIAAGEQAAGKVLAGLGADMGMVCEYEPGKPAVVTGHKLSRRPVSFHVGLLRKPEITVVPGRFRAFRDDFWHALAIGVFDLGGPKVAMASFHATPFGKHRRADEAERVVSILTRPDMRPPGLAAADWNAMSADTRADGSTYDADWYESQDWFDDLVHQCWWEYRDGVRHHWADCKPGETLCFGGLPDAAAVLDVPWQPTTGHWPGDPFPERRIDAIRATRDVIPALDGIETIRTPEALAASDHLPVVVTIEPRRFG